MSERQCREPPRGRKRVGHALNLGRPVAGLDTHDLDFEGFEAVATPATAVGYVESASAARRQK